MQPQYNAQQNVNYPSNLAYGQAQQYPQQPTMPSNPAQAAPGQAAAPGFIDPTVGAGTTLKIRNLEGRAVVMVPTGYNPAAKGMKPGETQEQITADVLVLDGGRLTYGDNQQTGTPATHAVETPYFATGMLITHVNIVRSLRDHVGKGVVLGRIERGITATQGNSRPWNLNKLHNAGEQGVPAAVIERDVKTRELAAQVWSARTLGTFSNPTPTPLGAPAQQGYGAPNAGPQVQAQGYAYPPQQYAQPAPSQNVYTPAAGTPVGQQPMVAQVPPQQAAPAATPAGTDAPPAGWLPAVWATLSPEQKSQVLGQQAAPQAPAGAPVPASMPGGADVSAPTPW